MGQYWFPVNLDKGEFISPHKLGAGLKLWEQLANSPGTGAALIILCAAMPEARGGGDLDVETNWHGPERTFPKHNMGPGPMPEAYPAIAKRTIGRWAGDRIALVGDYAEDSDLPPEFEASKIYDKCHETGHYEYFDEPQDRFSARIIGGKNSGKFQHFVVDAPPEFTDVTDDVCAVIEHELQGKFEGEGWRRFVYDDERR
jgi:hypothetical protein